MIKFLEKHPYIWYKLSTIFFKNYTLPQIENIYGKYSELKNFSELSFNLSNESQYFYWEIVKLVSDITDTPLTRVLLPWENDVSKEEIRNGLKDIIGKSEIVTAWLSSGVDYTWDFEEALPENIWKYSLIISQAMMEHLVDPYKHMKDLSSLLEEEGYLIVHTVMPGFMYHRHPVDTIRFFPDWFEEVASKKRLNLKIVSKYVRDFHIFYMYKKI